MEKEKSFINAILRDLLTMFGGALALQCRSSPLTYHGRRRTTCYCSSCVHVLCSITTSGFYAGKVFLTYWAYFQLWFRCTRNGTFSPKLLKDQDKINRAISAACGTDFPVPQKASVRAKNDGGGGGGGGSGDHSGPCVDTAVSEVFADSLLQEWKRIQDMCGSIKIKGPPTQEQIAEQRSKKKAQAAVGLASCFFFSCFVGVRRFQNIFSAFELCF